MRYFIRRADSYTSPGIVPADAQLRLDSAREAIS